MTSLFLLALGCTEPVLAGEPIVGQSDPEVDVAAVQAAVSEGGTVRLQGTFDFGDTGRVVLDNDVKIVGENATILRGENALYCDDPELEVSIRSVRFGRHPEGLPSSAMVDGPRGYAIWIRRAASARITGNTFRNIGVHYEYLNRHFGSAIMLGDPDGFADEESGTMDAVVASNDIDLGRYECDENGDDCVLVDPTVPVYEGEGEDQVHVGQDNLTVGIELFRAELDATIRDNTIRNCTRVGIYAIDDRGAIAIVGNDIACGEFGAQLHEESGWPLNYGMVLFCSWYDDSARGDSEFLVAHNRIAVSNPNSGGVVAQIDHSLVYDNEFDLSTPGGFYGIWAYGNDNALVGNRIWGNGLVGIWLDPWEPISGNLLTTNDLSGFTAWWLQLDMSGFVSDTLVVGNTFGNAGEAAIRVGGSDNTFLTNTHTGTFPGWSYGEGAWTGAGYWLMCGEDACPDWYPTSHGNSVIRPTLAEGTDAESQWRDQGEDNLLVP